ncbi:MAG: MATE family efflux transporter [Firmicutes bacterium]|nr:MATE family efflux transporter [Bacillota bacterium]
MTNQELENQIENASQLENQIELDSQEIEEDPRLDKPITTSFLLKFTIPTIISFTVMSIFGAIDGIFAARGISEEALSSVNFVMPFFTFSMAIAAMLSMGGCALVAKTKGQKQFVKARQIFTLLTITVFLISATFAIFGWIFRDGILRLLGTDEWVFAMARDYIQPLILMMPFIMVGMFLIQFLIAEGRPVVGMIASISGAFLSTALNALFIFGFNMGVEGLALATGIGYAVPALLGVVYFTFFRDGTIYFVKPTFDVRALGRSAKNGLSEMVTMMAATVITLVMNRTLVDLLGWQGVAAAGIVMAINGMFMSLYVGYSTGIAPVVSYNYGKKHKYKRKIVSGEIDDLELIAAKREAKGERHENLQKLFKKSLGIITVLAGIAVVGVLIFAPLLVQIYVDPGYLIAGLPGGRHYIGYYGGYYFGYVDNVNLHSVAVRGLRIAAIGYLFMGFNVFGTQWFTAFNDGLVSGFMSFMQTFVFTLVLLLTLPRIWDITGAWIALPGAEILTVFVTVFFFIKMGKKYGYLGRVENQPQKSEQGYSQQ